MTAMRVTLIACMAALLLAAGGCGGDSTMSAAGGGPGAAALVPDDVVAFVSLNTDADSDQVEQLREVADRFPIARGGLDRVVRELFAEEGLTWEADIEPALGDEVALAVLADHEAVVGLTQPDDVAKLNALLATADVEVETREVEGWQVFGEPDDVDAFEASRGGDALADSDAYADAFDGLADDALAKVYASGTGLESLADELGVPAQGTGSFDTAAVVLEAVDDGVRLDGRATGVEGAPADFEPQLLEQVPADAFAAVTFSGLDEAISTLRSAPVPGLPDIERALGVTLDDLGTLLAGEPVLYARSGVPIPEVTVVVEPENMAAALETLETLAEKLAELTGSSVQSAEVDGLEVQFVEVEGVRIQFADADGRIIVTTGIAGIRDFRDDGDKLTGSDDFQDAAESAGYGERTNGLVYVNFAEALPVVEGLAGLAGDRLPAEVHENLEPLESLFLHAHAQDGEVRFGGVLKTS
jgi:Protein of unknown function (DUF3352)